MKLLNCLKAATLVAVAGLVSVKRQVDEVVGILVTSSRNRG
jgi:hypothetical protein